MSLGIWSARRAVEAAATVSESPEPEPLVIVPDVTGMTVGDAVNALIAAGRPRWDLLNAAGVPMFACRIEREERHPDVFGGRVLSDADWEFVAGAEARVLARVVG